MIRLWQSSWVAAGIGAVLFLVTAAAVLNPRKLLNARQAQIAASAKKQTPHAGWDFSNPEIDQLIAELKMEKEGLALREQQLKELATRLAAERSEINQTTQAVNRLEKEFDERIVRVREEETANLKKLAKTYAAMSPERIKPARRQASETNMTATRPCLRLGCRKQKGSRKAERNREYASRHPRKIRRQPRLRNGTSLTKPGQADRRRSRPRKKDPAKPLAPSTVRTRSY